MGGRCADYSFRQMFADFLRRLRTAVARWRNFYLGIGTWFARTPHEAVDHAPRAIHAVGVEQG